jgi:methyl-accepting chemotaxis protein
LRYGFGNFISADEAARKKILDDEAKWYKLVDDNARSATPLMDTEKERAAFKYWQERYDAYVVAARVVRLVLAGRLEEAATYNATNTTPRGAENVEALETLVVVQRDDASEFIDNLSATSARAKIIVLGIAGLSLVLGVVAGWYMAQTISKATTAIAGALSDVSRGNVDTEISVKSNDQLGAMARSYGRCARTLPKWAIQHPASRWVTFRRRCSQSRLMMSSAIPS